MKIFKTNQIKEIDRLTIKNTPISSFLLMKRAARAFFETLLPHLSPEKKIYFTAGSGNNGGDAMVIATLLKKIGISPIVFWVPGKNISEDCQKAYDEFIEQKGSIVSVEKIQDLNFDKDSIMIDGLFGSGLNRPVEGLFADVIKKINESRCIVFSIDIPSGLFGEDNQKNIPENIINADYTFTFQMPKLSFFHPENEKYLGKVEILDIQLHPKALEEIPTPFFFTEMMDIQKLIRQRSKFSHKGSCGHALLIAGKYGMMGAAVLASKAALKTGCGLITTHAPKKGYEIMQLSIPEAIVSIDENDECFSKLPDISKFNAVGIGPGLGTDSKSESALHSLLLQIASPLVIDADAINILAKNKDWLSLLPKKTILTPHLKEFERLFGLCNSQYERWLTQLKFSTEYNIIILLKGAYSSISLPDGTLHINSTGNPGMATAGCGDVLTGMIISLLAQGYTPEESTLLGTWLHGKAADIYVCDDAMESLIASSIIQNIGKAFLSLEQTT